MNVMFAGQPGTGKTMAAEVIAADLAAEQHQPVSMRHSVRATVRELQTTAASADREERRRHG